MRRATSRARDRWRVAVVSGALFFLGGCDPTLRATIEDGIITVSQSYLTAFLRALVAAGQSQTTDSSTTGNGTTG